METEVMTSDMNLQFIKGKITQLRTAVMYSMSDSLTRLQNDIVTALQVDDHGHLWFICRGPNPAVKEYEQVFPARLSFFRKGCDFFLEVSGKATVINNNYTGETKGQRTLLVKMDMLNIEYTESSARRPKNKVETLLENGYKWLLRTAAVSRNSEGSILAKLQQTNYN
jgi:hypothetical protein